MKIRDHFTQIQPLDQAAMKAARSRQNQLTKPTGSLGRLEDLSIQLAGITANPRPRFNNKGIIIMAADHGVASEGVSAYPADVTPQMVMNFLQGGAAINVLARQMGAAVTVVDIGVAYDFKGIAGLAHRKISLGTQNIRQGPAMTLRQAEDAIQVGVEVIQGEIKNGLDLVATGEMGIANTTASSAITAVLTGLPAEQVTGKGTGVSDEGLQNKIQVIKEAIFINTPDSGDPMDVLSKLGGYEIAGLVGVMIGAAEQRVPVVIDGFISSAAALVATELVPNVKPYLIASHRSVEIGHQAIYKKMGLQPLLDLGMRLGEGSGAVLAFPIIDAAARLLDEMATFEEAGVSEKE